MMIDPVIAGFITNEGRSHLHIFDQSIITFGKIGFCSGFSSTSYVETVNRFRKVVLENINDVIEN